MEILRLNTLRDAKAAFLNPKRYEEYPRLFLYGSPPQDLKRAAKPREEYTKISVSGLYNNTRHNVKTVQ